MQPRQSYRPIRPVYYKAIEKGFKADSESRIVSGYLASFNNIDSDGDLLLPGCFTKSITDRGPSSSTARKIAFVWSHNIKEPIGHFTKLQEDETGLYFEAYVDKTQKGDEVLEMYKSGTLNQHSIGYEYVWDQCKPEEQKDGSTVFACYEIKLWEGSPVTIGANENTPFTGFKSEQTDDIRKELHKELNQVLKSLDSDIQFKTKQIISQLIALAEAGPLTEALNPNVEPRTDWSMIAKSLT